MFLHSPTLYEASQHFESPSQHRAFSMSGEKTVAFIGLGAMGWGIAENLAAAAVRGDVASPVLVWNRTLAKVGVLESGIGSFLIRISVLVRYQPNVRTRQSYG